MKITVIGGGTGLSVLLRGIKNIEGADISAVVSVADDGGGSGQLREDLGMLPPGDIRSCLLALASEEEGMQEILAYRFTEGHLAGQNIGNILIAGAGEVFGGFEKGLERISDILKVKGRVIPVSSDKMVLCAELENGNIVVGESQLPKVCLRENSKIGDVFLESKDVGISAAAKDAISTADIIVIGPGSLYTSIIPNLLVSGVTKAIAESEATVVYVGNVMTQPGETDGMSLKDHVSTLIKYMDDSPIHFVIANDKALTEAELSRYTDDGADQIVVDEHDKAYIAGLGVRLVTDDFIDIKKGYIRHGTRAVAAAIEEICRLQRI